MNWDEYYLDLCKRLLKASTCVFCQCGVVIVDSDNLVISTGYSHAVDNAFNCLSEGVCHYYKENGKYPHLGKQDECVSLHAEIFAILSADPIRVKGSTMYILGYDRIRKQYKTIIPDTIVMRIIQAAGVKRVVSLPTEEYQVLGHLFGDEDN